MARCARHGTRLQLCAALLLSLLRLPAAADDSLLTREYVMGMATPRVQANNAEHVRKKLAAQLGDDPLNDPLWGRLGWTYLALDNVTAAAACARTALRLRPYSARYRLLQAHVLLVDGKSTEIAKILAGAVQSNAMFFNHIKLADVRALIAAINDPAIRGMVQNQFNQLLHTDTFAAEETRFEILGEASGRIMKTWRERDNRMRVWIAVEDKFLEVYDETTRTRTDLAPKVAVFGCERTTVRYLAITRDRLLIAAGDHLLSCNRKAEGWQIVRPPMKGRLEVIDMRDDDYTTATVTFRDEHGDEHLFLFHPLRSEWLELPPRRQFLERLNDDPGRVNFAIRNGFPPPKTPIQAAAATSQWRDALTYVHETPVNFASLHRQRLQKLATDNGGTGKKATAYYKGMALPIWSRRDLQESHWRQALHDIKASGADRVSLSMTGYQHGPRSVEVIADSEKTLTVDEIRTVIHAARDSGLQVMLKPHLNLAIEAKDDHMWRGLIKPTERDVKAWFTSYTAFLMPYVDLAIAEQIEIFCVGVELKKMTPYTREWKILISNVRDRGYKGKLTYAALHDNFYLVRFWDALDYIGIDAYFEATRDKNAGLREIIAGYERWAERLEKFSSDQKRSIIFTEVGFNNQDGSNVRPWYWSGNRAELDNIEQAACYHAVLEVFPRHDWLAGMFWWSWSANRPPFPDEPHYSPQSKLAELVLRAYWRPQPTGSEIEEKLVE